MAEAGYAWASDLVNALFTVSVQTGVEDSGYAALHLLDWTTPEVWHQPAKLTGTSGAWLLTSTSSPPAATPIALAVLWLHNFDEALGVSLQGNDSDAWGSPAFSQAFTIPAAWADGRRVPVFLDLRTTSAATTGYAYYRLVVTGANTAPVAAKLLLYDTLLTVHGYLLSGAQPAGQEFKATTLLTDLGFVADLLLHEVRSRTFKADLVAETLVDKDALEAWYLDTWGGQPVCWIPNLLVNDAWIVRFATPLAPVPLSRDAWRLGLDLIELAPGAPL